MCISRVTQVIVIAFLFSLPIVESESKTNNMSGMQPSRCSWNPQDATKSGYNYRLIHTASGKYVELLNKGRVDTTKIQSDWTELTAIAVPGKHNVMTNSSAIMIRGTRAGLFICFNKKGKLISRATFVRKYCTFRELLTPNSYSRFESATNRNLSLGFNEKGLPVRGKKRPCQECFQFSKCSLDAVTERQRSQGPPWGHDEFGLFQKPINHDDPNGSSATRGGHRRRHGHQGPRGQG